MFFGAAYEKLGCRGSGRLIQDVCLYICSWRLNLILPPCASKENIIVRKFHRLMAVEWDQLIIYKESLGDCLIEIVKENLSRTRIVFSGYLLAELSVSRADSDFRFFDNEQARVDLGRRGQRERLAAYDTIRLPYVGYPACIDDIFFLIDVWLGGLVGQSDGLKFFNCWFNQYIKSNQKFLFVIIHQDARATVHIPDRKLREDLNLPSRNSKNEIETAAMEFEGHCSR